jgi:hypothetical protein
VTDTHITDAMRNAVGTVYERLVSFPISVSDVRRWVVATYHPEVPPREFWDEEFAAGTPAGQVTVPHEFNPFAWMTRDPSGLPPRIDGSAINRIEDSLGIAGPNLAQGLNGGLEVEYATRMRTGDVITSETAVDRYEEKSGRMGVMLMTRTLTTWANQDGDTVKKSYQTLIRY